jgi:hypothetical protein
MIFIKIDFLKILKIKILIVCDVRFITNKNFAVFRNGDFLLHRQTKDIYKGL